MIGWWDDPKAVVAADSKASLFSIYQAKCWAKIQENKSDGLISFRTSGIPKIMVLRKAIVMP